jgi:hypothetical protein
MIRSSLSPIPGRARFTGDRESIPNPNPDLSGIGGPSDSIPDLRGIIPIPRPGGSRRALGRLAPEKGLRIFPIDGQMMYTHFRAPSNSGRVPTAHVTPPTKYAQGATSGYTPGHTVELLQAH